MNHSKKAHHYLQSDNQALQTLFTKIKELDALHERVAAHLDPSLLTSCRVANITDNRLILLVANGSIATQIRFQSNELLRKFKQDPALQHIQGIHCKVRPVQALPPTPTAHAIPPLSDQTSAIIDEIAESLDDPALKESLKRIAHHGKNHR